MEKPEVRGQWEEEETLKVKFLRVGKEESVAREQGEDGWRREKREGDQQGGNEPKYSTGQVRVIKNQAHTQTLQSCPAQESTSFLRAWLVEEDWLQ